MDTIVLLTTKQNAAVIAVMDLLGPSSSELTLSASYISSSNLSLGLEVIKLGYSIGLKIKRNDWLLADMCPQGANHYALF